MMNDLFGRLRSTRKRVIAKRQLTILNCILDKERIDVVELYDSLSPTYRNLKNPWKAFTRDLVYLLTLNAIEVEGVDRVWIRIRLEWPTEITETAFFERVSQFPKAKTYKFLQKEGAVDELPPGMPLFDVKT